MCAIAVSELRGAAWTTWLEMEGLQRCCVVGLFGAGCGYFACDLGGWDVAVGDNWPG